MATKIYSVPNISCAHCVATIGRELREVPGVEDVEGDVGRKEVTVVYGDESVLSRVEEVLKEIGYPAAT